MARPLLPPTVSNPAENAWSFASWVVSAHEHASVEVSKAFDHVQKAVFQFFGPANTTDWNFASWAVATQKHIMTEAGKAFDSVHNAVLHFFSKETHPNTPAAEAPKNLITTSTGWPSVIIARSIAAMLEAKDAAGLYTFFTPEDREKLLLARPDLVTKLIRYYRADLDKVPAVWRQAFACVQNEVRTLDLHGIAVRPLFVKRIMHEFPRLRDFNVKGCELSDQSLYHLSKSQLEKLTLDENEDITEYGINWLSRLPKAKSLALPPFTFHVDLISAFTSEFVGNRVTWYPLPQTLEELTVYPHAYPLSRHIPAFFRLLKEHCRNLKQITLVGGSISRDLEILAIQLVSR